MHIKLWNKAQLLCDYKFRLNQDFWEKGAYCITKFYPIVSDWCEF